MKRTLRGIGIAALSFTATVIASLLVGPMLSDASAITGGRPARVTPVVGHYEGRDSHDSHIRFYYDHHGHVTDFRIEHELLGNGTVDPIGAFHVCTNDVCAHGRWHSGHLVAGVWENKVSGHKAPFDAHYVQPPPVQHHGLF